MTTSTTPYRAHTGFSLLAVAIREALQGIRFRIAAAEIRKAIAAGEITEEEGRGRLAALRQRTATGRGEGGL